MLVEINDEYFKAGTFTVEDGTGCLALVATKPNGTRKAVKSFNVRTQPSPITTTDIDKHNAIAKMVPGFAERSYEEVDERRCEIDRWHRDYEQMEDELLELARQYN